MSASTCVDVLRTDDGTCYVVVTPVKSSETVVVTIDPISGNPLYAGVPFLDQFPLHSMTVEHLEKLGAKKKVTGCGVIGVLQSNHVTTVGVVTRAEATGKIPGGHVVWTVRDASFIDIHGPGASPKGGVFDDFQINDCHFFCDTYNLTTLFPSDGKERDTSFTWNTAWKKAFLKLGIDNACIDLLQGVCRSDDFGDFAMTYVARRSVLNPGTRFIARGLNEKCSPGNEVECELIFVRGDKFWTVKWRRGSIPIRWKTSNNGVNVKHTVGQDFFNGTQEYFEGLMQRYQGINVRCISLLRESEDHAEEEIKYYYMKAIRMLYERGISWVQFCPFDLNKCISENGSAVALVEFMKFITPLTKDDTMTSGTLPNTITQTQNAIQRFNCADSLDRTNLATFYYAMKVTSEWCLSQGIGIADPNADYTTPNKIVIQPIIDFLATSFVSAGNVISYMYTNTPAIRAKAIKKFSKAVVKQTADAAVTMKRLYENMVNDRQRMKIIEQWTTPVQFKWIHRVDPRYISIVPRQETRIPREILGSVMKQFRFSRDQSEILLALPCPMQVLSVYVLAHPAPLDEAASRVVISVGNSLDDMTTLCNTPFPNVETSSWLKYNLLKAERWAVGASRYRRWVRLVSIRFEVPGERFVIGNIRLETRSIMANRPEMEEFTLVPSNECLFVQFNNDFEKFVSSKQRFEDVLELETKRLALQIPESYRNLKALELGINPWRCDPEGQLAAVKPSQCPVCKKYLTASSSGDVECYKQCEICKGLVMKSSEKSQIRICKSCQGRIESIALTSEKFERDYQPTSKGIPVFRRVAQDPELFQKSMVLSGDSSAIVVEDTTGCVWTPGKTVTLPPNSSRNITILICQPAIVLESHFYVNNGTDLSVTDKSTSLEKANSDGKLIFRYHDHPVTQIIELTLETGATPVDVNDIRILYIPSEPPVVAQSFAKPIAPLGLRANAVKSAFDASSRTTTFEFHTSKICKFQVTIASNSASPTPQSFILACYKANNIEYSETIVLPELESGKKLWFCLSKPVVCDRVCVFFIDRQPSIQPHVVSLVFEP